jgi:hypothetical protein
MENAPLATKKEKASAFVEIARRIGYNSRENSDGLPHGPMG